MAKGDSMYDNPRSEKAERKGEEKAVEKKAVDKAKESEGAKMADKEKDGGDEEHEKGEDTGISEMMSGFKKLLASHEAERRDHHNGHREALRQMANRHSKAIRDHFEAAGAKMGGGAPAPEEGGAAPAPDEAGAGGEEE